MNKQCFFLLRTQLLNQFKLNDLKVSASAKTRKHALLMACVFIFVTVIFGGYSFSLGYGLGFMGLSHLIPAYALTVTGIITIFFTFLKTNGILFGFRDYDLLMSLPIKTSTVIASRFLTMYFMNMLFTVLLMLPMGIAYVYWARPSLPFYLIWLIGMFAAPLIPTTIATLLGALIIALASRFKYSNALGTVFTFLLIVGILIFSMAGGTLDNSTFTVANMANIGTLIYDKICAIYPLASLFTLAAIENNLLAFLCFLVLSGGWYLLFVKLLSLKYNVINSGLRGQVTKSNYKMKDLHTASPLKALYRKELKRLFSTSVYIVNIGVGIIMTILFVIACVVFSPEKIETVLKTNGFAEIFIKIIPFMISTTLSMTCTTSAALSLEGKNLWIVQSTPLTSKTIFDSKILVNLSLLLPTALICSTLLSIRLKPDLLNILLLFAIPLIYAFFTSVWGMFINIKLPNFDWESETTAVKQSASSLLGILGSLFPAAGIGVLLLLPEIDYRSVSLVIAVVMLIITAGLYHLIGKVEVRHS